ncbi:MAG: hypothetical protein K0V04_17085 [Deltaproteobacteria bacterium]|nr:hypothetical protein [Deltaproteobacteria bacterium]
MKVARSSTWSRGLAGLGLDGASASPPPQADRWHDGGSQYEGEPQYDGAPSSTVTFSSKPPLGSSANPSDDD